MRLRLLAAGSEILLPGCLLLSLLATGCQSTTGGQAMPSGSYLRDDAQYFPHGPENQLSRQKEAIDEYQQHQKTSSIPRGSL